MCRGYPDFQLVALKNNISAIKKCNNNLRWLIVGDCIIFLSLNEYIYTFIVRKSNLRIDKSELAHFYPDT